MIASKYYKPEILACPKCKARLVYRHAISNKKIYYSNGKQVKIHNLGYSCPKCSDGKIYASQTANKISLRGITYSTKIVCMIAKLKERHMSRDEICDFFYTKGIEISDRNIDNLYKRYKEYLQMDYKKKIPMAFEQMLKDYGQIRLSIDLITVYDSIFIIVYDYFTFDILAFVCFNGLEDKNMNAFLESFLNPEAPITVIASIRKDSYFIPLLKSLCSSKTKFIAYTKY